ncbi:hypothetical protein TTHERM_01085710 (macronuclear) [Tetrahymena thermophila SB210]|uniref:Kinase domain protein n=1 Tax=Tetrahymena thermophila (strain SB210) TaxID=312017 RepID=Q22BP9_TETTS|nr:hypothetical protein TTHERM_01085710 [Tetrahymena thermophila SB210]EAR82740.2 hypothetical protein TTHERM_01085710 [Tetrahymena thermophila SB210]|eukprot:XP_001030403.2 hypothetical protein TTHERM_01085710 [Tetrahymena thermophila SB210]
MIFTSVQQLENEQNKVENRNYITIQLVEIFIQNDETDRILQLVSQNEQQLHKLSLTLSYSRINDEGAIKLCCNIEKFISIKQLYLSLRGNRSTFLGLKQIIAKISSLKYLESLNIDYYDNNLQEEDSEQIFDDLIRCQNLQSVRLNLDHNKISTKGALNILQSLGKLNQLQKLQLSMNQNLIGQDQKVDEKIDQIKQIFNDQQQFKNLKYLKLSLKQNYIDNNLFQVIQNFFNGSKDLLSLSLSAKSNSFCQISLRSLLLFTNKFNLLQDLSLGLSQVQLRVHDLVDQTESQDLKIITFGDSLQRVKLRFIESEVDSYQDIIKILSFSKDIYFLKISNQNSKIDDAQFENLLKNIHLLQNLQHLEVILKYNDIRTYRNQFNSLKQCKSLQSLNLDFHLNKEIDSTIFINLIKVLQECPSFNSLNLNLLCCENLGEDEEVSFMLKELYRINQLKKLNFQAKFCNLRLTTNLELVKLISNCACLEFLNLELNEEHGVLDLFLNQISMDLQNLSQLRVLQMSVLASNISYDSIKQFCLNLKTKKYLNAVQLYFFKFENINKIQQLERILKKRRNMILVQIF